MGRASFKTRLVQTTPGTMKGVPEKGASHSFFL
jgi:hypothetical protein